MAGEDLHIIGQGEQALEDAGVERVRAGVRQVDEVGPSLRYASAKVTKAERGGSGGGFGGQQGGGYGGQQNDPWATGGSAPQGGQQGGYGQQAPQQPQGGQGGQQGGWGQAPSYDEPPF